MIGSGESATEVTTHELHVPVDRQLDVHLTALDVLHSFWVPEWGIKRDAVPARDPEAEGVDNTFVVTPDQEGTFSLVCTELCGTGHATMRATVVVESQEDFDQWLERAGGIAVTGRGSGWVVQQRWNVGLGGRARGSGDQDTRAGTGGHRVRARGGLRLRPRRRAARDLRAGDLPDRADRLPAPDRPGDHRPARLPGRARGVRLLAALGARRADDARGPLPARRQVVARLLQVQHRSQGDRDPVHRHHLLLLPRRWPDRDADPRRAGPARDPDRRPGPLQRPLLHPRGADDLRLRDPGLRRDRQLRAAADDRGAGHGVPAAERALLLDAADGRPALPGQLHRPRRGLRRRLDRLRAVVHRGPAGAVVLQPRASSSPARHRSRRR